MLSYEQTLAAFESTRHFMPDGRSSLDQQYANILKLVMDDAWQALGRPSTLVVKQCPLTLYLPLLMKLLPQALSVVGFRDPRDVVASRIKADAKNPSPYGPGLSDAHKIHAQQYARIYASCLDLPPSSARRVFYAQYEDLVSGGVLGLEDFLGIAPPRPEMLWRRATHDVANFEAHYLFSEGWGSPVTDAYIGQHRGALSESQLRDVHDITENTWKNLKLRLEAQTSVSTSDNQLVNS